jgi:hypothetical protein
MILCVAGYALMDATVKYDLARFGLPGSSVGVNVNNLFDREYVSSCYSEYAYWGRTSGRRDRHLPFLTTYGRGSPRLYQVIAMQEQTPHAETTFALDRVTFACLAARLHPLSLTFPAGKVGLIGHNGSGKSTLLKMLGRHQPPPQARCCWTAAAGELGQQSLCPQSGLSAAAAAAGGRDDGA